VSQVELASLIGVSQPRVSQVLARLSKAGAVDSTVEGYNGRPARLIKLYLSDHGPALAAPDVAWYSLEAMHKQVERACAHARSTATRVAVSADLAPDLLAAWRHPTLTVIYTAGALDLTAAGFVRAEGRIDATVLVRHTTDSLLLASCEPWPRDVDGIPLVDPVQQIWDLHDLGGEDRAEAADRLRRAVLDRALTVDHLIPAAKAGRPSRQPRSKR
jgi:DNA-binding transcriptional ArsR family regulator